MEMMNETIPCVKCRYSVDVIGTDNIDCKCTKFNFIARRPLENGCTFGIKRITNADKLEEIFGESIAHSLCCGMKPEWMNAIYEESKDE